MTGPLRKAKGDPAIQTVWKKKKSDELLPPSNLSCDAPSAPHPPPPKLPSDAPFPPRPLSNPSPPTIANNPLTKPLESSHLITKCSNFYVFAAVCASICLLTTRVAYIITNHRVFDRAGFLTGPNSLGAICVSVFLQPRNNSKRYISLLCLQFAIVGILPFLLSIAFIPSSKVIIARHICSCFGNSLLFKLGFSVRKRIARLPDRQLSRFLTDSLLFPSFEALAVVAFFALDPVRCWLEYPEDIDMCQRTLLGQAGEIGREERRTGVSKEGRVVETTCPYTIQHNS